MREARASAFFAKHLSKQNTAGDGGVLFRPLVRRGGRAARDGHRRVLDAGSRGSGCHCGRLHEGREDHADHAKAKQEDDDNRECSFHYGPIIGDVVAARNWPRVVSSGTTLVYLKPASAAA